MTHVLSMLSGYVDEQRHACTFWLHLLGSERTDASCCPTATSAPVRLLQHLLTSAFLSLLPDSRAECANCFV